MSENGSPIEFHNGKVGVSIQATSLLAYTSNGHCLIVAGLDQGLQIAERLTGLERTVLVPDRAAIEVERKVTEDGLKVYSGADLQLSGYLGAFDCQLGGTPSLASRAGLQDVGGFDLVLDFSDTALLTTEVAPFGYYWLGHSNEQQIDEVLQTLPQMRGEFEKPKYFNYNGDICAHSRSGIVACSNCLDVCGTNAISSSGEGIEVNAYLCQGCGSCALSCPSGAITYVYPTATDAIAQLSNQLQARRDAGISKTIVLLHDRERGSERVADASLDSSVLPLAIEEVAATGMDFWFSALAFGATAVVIDAPGDDSSAYRALFSQLQIANEMLAPLQLGERLVMRSTTELAAINQYAADTAELVITPASYKTYNNKRQTVRLAIDYLLAQTESDCRVVALPKQAANGQIRVDQQACTLCLACVTVCPGRALQDGETLPQLKFIESNCLQCGLCEQACPEDAISLESRYLYDSIEARQPRIVNQETPFNCVVCNKAFATERIIGRMLSKLSGHWMFESEASTRRLKMCEDCRVKDIFNDGGGIDVHRDA